MSSDFTQALLAKLGVSPDDALLMIQGHAFSTGRSVMEVAAEIVDGTLAFRRRHGRIEVEP